MKGEISNKDRKKALHYLMFIKEERDGTVKAKVCADKEEANSPTV